MVFGSSACQFKVLDIERISERLFEHEQIREKLCEHFCRARISPAIVTWDRNER